MLVFSTKLVKAESLRKIGDQPQLLYCSSNSTVQLERDFSMVKNWQDSSTTRETCSPHPSSLLVRSP